jgi:hypothetical protein
MYRDNRRRHLYSTELREDYFRNARLVRETLAEVWNDLERVGIVEFSVIE